MTYSGRSPGEWPAVPVALDMPCRADAFSLCNLSHMFYSPG